MGARVFGSVAAAVACCLLSYAHPAAAARPVGARASSHAVAASGLARRRPGIRGGVRRAQAAVAPAYTIHPIGAPLGGGYTYSFPLGFNNTGQIFGVAGRTGYPRVDCVVWNGSAFITLPLRAATADANCAPAGMNDADATTGDYEIVGSLTEPYSFVPYAFAVVTNNAGFLHAPVFYEHGPSAMIGVNASETAVAAAQFSRDAPYDPSFQSAINFSAQLYFSTNQGANTLTQVQAGSAAAPAVHYLIPTYPNVCVFGGCSINDRNQVLGFDYLTYSYPYATAALYTLGDPSSLTHLPIQDTELEPALGGANTGPVAFNDAGQLLYMDATSNAAVVYDADTGVRTVLPVVPPGCPAPVTVEPISMNNKGEVLGFVSNCPNPTYFTWDPNDGTQFLNAQLPSSASTITPLGVNDAGQILIVLTSTSNVNTWGTLDPVLPAQAKARARKHVRG